MTRRRLATLVAALTLALAPGVRAQIGGLETGVRGVVVTTESLGIPLAIVELRTRTDSTARQTAQTTEAGRFLFTGVAPGMYHLLIRRIGYRASRTVDFTVSDGLIRDLGMIRMEAAAVELATIEVTVERPDISFEADRTGYLAEALGGQPGAVITDVLKNVPEVTIDFDGTVRVRGATPAIFINGQPAPMSGTSLAVFLEQFPADQIERIEILDAPPARYSAEGAAGIINIVLKQGVNLGITGSASLSAGTRGQRTASGRATMHRGPLMTTASLNTRWSDSRSEDFTLRQNLLADPVTFLQQDARSRSSGRSGGASLDMRYTLGKKSLFWGRASGDLNGSDRRGLTSITHMDQDRLPTLGYDRLARTDNSGGSGHGMAGYTFSWIPQRHTLEFQVSGQLNDNSGDIRDEIEYDPLFAPDGTFLPWLTWRNSGNRTTGLTMEASYTRPWGRTGRLEVGTSWRDTETTEDQVTRLFLEQGSDVADQVDTRLVSRIQRVGSAFVSANRRVGPISLNAGLRGEQHSSDVVLPSGDLLARDEAHLFPTVNVNWNPRQRVSLRLGYSRRVNRPGVSVLDPTDRSTDPLNRIVGNPDIKSSVSHNFNLGVSWGGRFGQFNFGPYVNRTLDGWEQITTVDEAGISTTTWANLTSRTNLGTSLNWSLPRLAGWRANLNMSASRSTLSGSIRNTTLRNGQLFWAVGANLDGVIYRTLSGQGSFGYQPPRELVQGRSSGQWRADLSLRYRMRDNRTNISMSVTDPFLLRRTTQQLTDPSVIQTGRSRVTTRSMNLSISYSFGGRPRPMGGPAGGPAVRVAH